jgi:tripartite-type tricarboxylate transporter receptor subunit TctC
MRLSRLLALAIAVIGTPATAQDFPTRPIQLITPAAAGNSPDVITRVVADRLGQLWGQQVVVLNRPGAGGMIALQAAAGLPNDGYSLYAVQASTVTVLPVDQAGKMAVDIQKAFVPIGMVGEQPIGLGVNKDVPVKSAAELIALAAKTPEGLLFGAIRGGQAHLTGELFRERAKANISFVHATGTTSTLNDVIGGRIPIMFEALAGLFPGLQSGSVRAIAVASTKRLPNMPDLPTMDETVPGVISSGWVVLMAPAGTPDAIVQKINADLRRVVAMPEVIERFQQLGTYTRDMTPEQTAAFMRAEEQLWWPVVRGLKR